MKKLNYPRLFLAALVMAIVFVIAEFIVKGIASVAFGISEEKLLENANLTLSGFRYHVINILYLYLICCLAMWLYASLLSRYTTPKHSVFATVVFFLMLVLLVATNIVNIGLIPFAAGLASVVFNVLELTPAIIVGASVYSPESDSNQ